MVYIHIYLREFFGVVLWEEINNILRLIIIPMLKVLEIIWIAAFWRAKVFNYNLCTDSNKVNLQVVSRGQWAELSLLTFPSLPAPKSTLGTSSYVTLQSCDTPGSQTISPTVTYTVVIHV